MSGPVVSGSGWLAWVRGLPRASVLVFCGIVLAAVQAVLGLVEAPVGVRLGAVVLVAAVAGAAELDKLHARRQEQREAEQDARRAGEVAEADWLRRARDWLRVWPAPLMEEVDPYTLGVVRSPLANRYAPPDGHLPPYVGRDRDGPALERLRAQGLLLIVGAPASGVTRTAYEVARADPTARVVLAPRAPDGLRTALDDLDVLSKLGPRSRLLLWLDRVDGFAGEGLTVGMLHRLRERSPGLRVVATISTTRYGTWAIEQPDLATEFGDPVMLERTASPAELERAEAAYPGVDFEEGIAAAFTAAWALLVRYHAGDADCPYEPAGGDCPIARAVLAVAIGWAGTGTTRPLPVAGLSEQVQRRQGLSAQPDPRHLARAMEWAATPTPQGMALLARGVGDPTGETVQAHREVAEILSAQERPSEDVWAAAVEEAAAAADSEAVGSIGFRAHVEGEADAAPLAWAQITTLDEPGAGWLERAATFSHRRRDPRAELPLRQHLLKLTEAKYGPDDPNVAAALDNLGIAWLVLREPGRARGFFERALHIKERAYGPDHPEVATTLDNLGNAWRELGEPGKAREQLGRALQIKERAYGPDHPEVASTLGNLGIAWRGLGEPGKARELLGRVLPIMERAYGPDHPTVAPVLTHLGDAWFDLAEPGKARELYERALRIEERAYGPGHLGVVATLNDLGLVWVRLGEPGKARDQYVRALRILRTAFPNGHPDTDVVIRNLRSVAPDIIVLDDGRIVHRAEQPPPDSPQT